MDGLSGGHPTPGIVVFFIVRMQGTYSCRTPVCRRRTNKRSDRSRECHLGYIVDTLLCCISGGSELCNKSPNRLRLTLKWEGSVAVVPLMPEIYFSRVAFLSP